MSICAALCCLLCAVCCTSSAVLSRASHKICRVKLVPSIGLPSQPRCMNHQPSPPAVTQPVTVPYSCDMEKQACQPPNYRITSRPPHHVRNPKRQPKNEKPFHRRPKPKFLAGPSVAWNYVSPPTHSRTAHYHFCALLSRMKSHKPYN